MIMKLRAESRDLILLRQGFGGQDGGQEVQEPEAKRWAARSLPVSLTGISLQLSAFSLLILSGCATAPKPVPVPQPILAPRAASVPAAAPVVAKPAPSQPASVSPGTPSPRVPSPVVAPALAKNEFVLAIESEPAGAIIVVNNTPVGKAPLKLAIKGTPLGFFRDYVMVKARFLATSLTETSITVEEDCTPLEKIPGKLIFTPQGAQRRQP